MNKNKWEKIEYSQLETGDKIRVVATRGSGTNSAYVAKYTGVVGHLDEQEFTFEGTDTSYPDGTSLRGVRMFRSVLEEYVHASYEIYRRKTKTQPKKFVWPTTVGAVVRASDEYDSCYTFVSVNVEGKLRYFDCEPDGIEIPYIMEDLETSVFRKHIVLSPGVDLEKSWEGKKDDE